MSAQRRDALRRHGAHNMEITSKYTNIPDWSVMLIPQHDQQIGTINHGKSTITEKFHNKRLNEYWIMDKWK